MDDLPLVDDEEVELEMQQRQQREVAKALRVAHGVDDRIATPRSAAAAAAAETAAAVAAAAAAGDVEAAAAAAAAAAASLTLEEREARWGFTLPELQAATKVVSVLFANPTLFVGDPYLTESRLYTMISRDRKTKREFKEAYKLIHNEERSRKERQMRRQDIETIKKTTMKRERDDALNALLIAGAPETLLLCDAPQSVEGASAAATVGSATPTPSTTATGTPVARSAPTEEAGAADATATAAAMSEDEVRERRAARRAFAFVGFFENVKMMERAAAANNWLHHCHHAAQAYRFLPHPFGTQMPGLIDARIALVDLARRLHAVVSALPSVFVADPPLLGEGECEVEDITAAAVAVAIGAPLPAVRRAAFAEIAGGSVIRRDFPAGTDGAAVLVQIEALLSAEGDDAARKHRRGREALDAFIARRAYYLLVRSVAACGVLAQDGKTDDPAVVSVRPPFAGDAHDEAAVLAELRRRDAAADAPPMLAPCDVRNVPPTAETDLGLIQPNGDGVRGGFLAALYAVRKSGAAAAAAAAAATSTSTAADGSVSHCHFHSAIMDDTMLDDDAAAYGGNNAQFAMNRIQTCHTCKAKYTMLHPFYYSLCGLCADFNYQRRLMTRDLRGKVVLITGCRIKIGYAMVLSLLRCGATVLGTTRFAHDAAARFMQEADYAEWKDRLHLFSLDLRDLWIVTQFCGFVSQRFPKLFAIINNAAQTIARTPQYTAALRKQECAPAPQLIEAVRGSGHAAEWNGFFLTHSSLTVGQALQLECHADPGTTPFVPDETFDASAAAKAAPSPSAAAAANAVARPAAAAAESAATGGGGAAASGPFVYDRYDTQAEESDLREKNSWTMNLGEVSGGEAAEVMAINALAPFVLNSKLKPLLLNRAGDATPNEKRFIINVSAMEGQFYRFKQTTHPHTNMAKAALNMMTRTSAPDYATDGIYMNASDTGWITDESPAEKKKRRADDFMLCPLDEVDAAARCLHLIYEDSDEQGKFWKDFHTIPW